MRYFCHHCHTHLDANELLPEFTCPQCGFGFVEEINIPASRRSSSNVDEDNRAGSDDGVSGLISTRMSSDEFSDDNSDNVEYITDAVSRPLAQIISLFQPHPQSSSSSSTTPTTATNSSTTATTTTATTTTTDQTGQSSHQQSADNSRTPQQQTSSRSATSDQPSASPAVSARPYIPGVVSVQYPTQQYSSNQTLTDVLNDFITGVSFGTHYPDGTSSSSQGAGHGSRNSGQVPANRGLINIDFPLPFFLHSNPGDYAWGNAGFDAVITQLLNNLDGSNSGPPPMPKDQVDTLPTVKISDDQVRGKNLQCSVCMDDFQVGDSARQLPCEHFFHQDCIIPWLNLVSIHNHFLYKALVVLSVRMD